ncbi:MAG: hypothetical protein AAGI52_10275 [Bacteroidota bacterium]
MRTALFLLPLLALAACDALGSDVADYDGIVEISLVSVNQTTAAVQLVAVDDTGCNRPLLTDLDREGLTRTITVEGIRVPQGGECEALIPARAEVVFETGPDLLLNVTLQVRHAGETDEYLLSGGSDPRLTVVRSTATRLAP